MLREDNVQEICFSIGNIN